MAGARARRSTILGGRTQGHRLLHKIQASRDSSLRARRGILFQVRPSLTRHWPTADLSTSSTSAGPTGAISAAPAPVRPDRGVWSANWHADLLREAVDGLAGEGPPAWRHPGSNRPRLSM